MIDGHREEVWLRLIFKDLSQTYSLDWAEPTQYLLYLVHLCLLVHVWSHVKSQFHTYAFLSALSLFFSFSLPLSLPLPLSRSFSFSLSRPLRRFRSRSRLWLLRLLRRLWLPLLLRDRLRRECDLKEMKIDERRIFVDRTQIKHQSKYQLLQERERS